MARDGQTQMHGVCTVKQPLDTAHAEAKSLVGPACIGGRDGSEQHLTVVPTYEGQTYELFCLIVNNKYCLPYIRPL